METVLTRTELEELVGEIAAEVIREIKPASGLLQLKPGGGQAIHKDDVCEGCPRHAPPSSPSDPRAIRLTPDVRTLASLLDHTLLRPEATAAQVEELCEEARVLGTAAVCVNPAWVPLAAEKMRGSRVMVATVAGFPLGATSTAAKRAEAQAAILAGASEVDMVIDIGALRSGDLERVEQDVRGVVEACHAARAAVKVILENAYLTDAQKVAACEIVKRAGAEFVKSSTGFGPSGATEADVRLMRQTVGSQMGVKAAGGIRSLADALRMLQAGATRLGTSSSVAILAEAATLA